MKYFILLMALSSTCFSYDGKIKDNYGRTIGYIKLDEDNDKSMVYDVKGRKQYEIDQDFKVRNTDNRRRGSIKWND